MYMPETGMQAMPWAPRYCCAPRYADVRASSQASHQHPLLDRGHAQLCCWSVCCSRVLLHKCLAFLLVGDCLCLCFSCQPEILPPPVGRRFLNRILGLPLARQNLLFNYFFLTLTSQIQTAKAEGKYSEGVSDLSGGKLVEVKEPQVGSEHPAHTQWGNSIVHLLP